MLAIPQPSLKPRIDSDGAGGVAHAIGDGFDCGNIEEANPRAPPDTFELDVSSHELSMFLDLLHFTRVSELFNFRNLERDVDYIRPMLLLADRFDADKVRLGLTTRLHALAKLKPWAVLALASDRDDVELGRAAIRCMTPSHIHNVQPTTTTTIVPYGHAGPKVDCRSDSSF